MADLTFAILVPLASPIQPVATPTHGTKVHVTTAHLIGAGVVQDFKMIPAAPGVNSSMRNVNSERCDALSLARAMPNAAEIRHASVGTNVW